MHLKKRTDTYQIDLSITEEMKKAGIGRIQYSIKDQVVTIRKA